jgi:hypothetical protein
LEQVLWWGAVATSGRKEVARKGFVRVNIVQICVQMCENAIMMPHETIPGIRRGDDERES